MFGPVFAVDDNRGDAVVAEAAQRITDALRVVMEQGHIGRPAPVQRTMVVACLVGGLELGDAVFLELQTALTNDMPSACILERVQGGPITPDEGRGFARFALALQPATRLWRRALAGVEYEVRRMESGVGRKSSSFDIDSAGSRVVFAEYPQLAGRLGLAEQLVSADEIDKASTWLQIAQQILLTYQMADLEKMTMGQMKFIRSIPHQLRLRRRGLVELIGDGGTKEAWELKGALTRLGISDDDVKQDPVLSGVGAALFDRQWTLPSRATRGVDIQAR